MLLPVALDPTASHLQRRSFWPCICWGLSCVYFDLGCLDNYNHRRWLASSILVIHQADDQTIIHHRSRQLKLPPSLADSRWLNSISPPTPQWSRIARFPHNSFKSSSHSIQNPMFQHRFFPLRPILPQAQSITNCQWPVSCDNRSQVELGHYKLDPSRSCSNVSVHLLNSHDDSSLILQGMGLQCNLPLWFRFNDPLQLLIATL